jgi:hypothetical protein
VPNPNANCYRWSCSAARQPTSADRPSRGPAAERGSQTLGLGRVTAEELDAVTARDAASGYGAGHTPDR